MSLENTIGLYRPAYPDFGQVFYVVDSDYRTAAQGWSRVDRTGPLDLYEARKAGRGGTQYVFRTGDYTDDDTAIQAAIDAQTDFRGDVLFYTPGAYSINTALTVDVPDARWLGRPVGAPEQSGAEITAAVAAAIAIGAAADRMEVAFLRFIPLTASHIFEVADGANYGYFHHFFYNALGITANVATQFMLALGAQDHWWFDQFVFSTDAAQGPFTELDGTAAQQTYSNFRHYHTGANTLAISLVDDDGAGATSIHVGPGWGQIGGTGLVTTLYDLVNKTAAATNVTIDRFYGSVGYATTTTLVTSAGAVNDIDIVDSWIATVEGGAGRAAYVGAA